MSDHYTLEAFSESYAVFGSRWGECLVVDRATRANYYDHSDRSGEECDALSKLEGAVFDRVCEARIGDALPPGVITCLDAMGRVEKKTAPYSEWCRDPELCKGKGYCPRDPTCGD